MCLYSSVVELTVIPGSAGKGPREFARWRSTSSQALDAGSPPEGGPPFHTILNKWIKHRIGSRTEAVSIKATPQAGCLNPGPGTSRQLLKYNNSKWMSTALRYYPIKYDFVGLYSRMGCRCIYILPVVGYRSCRGNPGHIIPLFSAGKEPET